MAPSESDPYTESSLNSDVPPASAPTVVSGLASSLLNGVRAMGADVDMLLATTGIPKRRIEQPSSRMRAEAYNLLWAAAVKELGREDLGLVVGESHMRPSSYGVVGFLAACGPTFGDALGAIAEHYRLIAPHCCSFTLNDRTGVMAISARPGQGSLAVAFTDSIAATYAAAARSMTGEDVSPIRVRLQRKRPTSIERHAFDALFRAPLTFEARSILVEFDREVLELKIKGAEPALRSILQKVVKRDLDELEQEDPIITELRDVIFEELARGRPRVGSAARMLGVSARTLQRRLGEANLTFRDVVDQVSCQEAERLLRDRSLSVGEVARVLGYRDLRAFSRAFKRWTTQAPTEFRQRY